MLFLKMLAFSEIYVLNWTYINSVKTTLYYGTKKSIGCPFASFSWKQICSHAIFVRKCPFSKNHFALMPIFCKKIVHSLKNKLLHVMFFKFVIKNPFCHAHIWSRKRPFCQNYPISWAKKVDRMPFFSKKCPKIHYKSCQKKWNTTSKYTIISNKKRQNIQNVQQYFKIPYKKNSRHNFSPI